MSKQDNPFRPEYIDEQIEQFSREQATHTPFSSGARLISDLHAAHKEDAEIVKQVWGRLAARSAEKYQANVVQHPVPQNTREDKQKGTQPMKPTFTEKQRRKRRSRTLELLAAVITVGVLVGSMLVVFHTKQPTQTRLGTPPRTPTAQADANGIYLSTKSGIDKVSLQSGKRLWHIALDWASQPFVMGNIVFFNHEVSDDYFLEAVNATTGKQLWRKNYGSSSFLLQANGILYNSTCIASPNGEASGCFIDAIRPADGALLWSFSTFQGTSWITMQNNVIYGASFSHLFALNATTGTPIWQKKLSYPHQEISQTPLVLNHTLYAASCNTNKLTTDYLSCYFLAFNIADGTEVWHTPVGTTNGVIQANPVSTGSVVYYANLGLIYAVNAHTGSITWTYTACNRNCGVGNLILDQNTLYIQIDGDRSSLLALNLARRSILWSKNLVFYYGETGILDQGLIYVVSDEHHVEALATTSGGVIKSYMDAPYTITSFTLVTAA
jgi:outer membrane protein assembly factor BamB